MDVAAAFVSNGESAEAVEPGEAALDHPAVPAKLFFAVDAAAGNSWQDTAAATCLPTAWIVIALVRMAFFRPPLRPTWLSANGRYGIEHLLEHGAVMDIRAGQPHRERNAAPVGHQVPFRARLAAIRWIWARGRAPFLPLWMRNPRRPG